MGVLLGLIDMLRVLPPRVQAGIRTIADRSDWSMRHLLRAMIPPATPSFGATAGAADEIGFEGVDLEDLMKRLDTSPREPRPDEPTPFEPSNAASWFDGEGPLAAVLSDYEPRSEQTAMTEAVAASLSQGSRLVVEAGTGVGKSLAYLLPAVRHAVGNGERVVVSTNTINLQEQLLTKDIPAALETLERVGEIADGEARAALLKGRANYLCLRRWATLRRGESLSAAEARLTAKVLVWLQTTSTGDRNELSLNPQDFPIWSRLSAQGAEGQIGRCPFAKQGRCFYQAARRRAESADVVVVNHALLALGATNDGLLPDYDHLVIDEAHNLEEVVTNQWGFTVNEEAFDRVLERVVGGAAAGTGVATPPRRPGPLHRRFPTAARRLRRNRRRPAGDRPPSASASHHAVQGDHRLRDQTLRERRRLQRVAAADHRPAQPAGVVEAADRLGASRHRSGEVGPRCREGGELGGERRRRRSPR